MLLAWLGEGLSLDEEIFFGESYCKCICNKNIFKENIYFNLKKNCFYLRQSIIVFIHWILPGSIISGGYIFVVSLKYIFC